MDQMKIGSNTGRKRGSSPDLNGNSPQIFKRFRPTSPEPSGFKDIVATPDGRVFYICRYCNKVFPIKKDRQQHIQQCTAKDYILSVGDGFQENGRQSVNTASTIEKILENNIPLMGAPQHHHDGGDHLNLNFGVSNSSTDNITKEEHLSDDEFISLEAFSKSVRNKTNFLKNHHNLTVTSIAAPQTTRNFAQTKPSNKYEQIEALLPKKTHQSVKLSRYSNLEISLLPPEINLPVKTTPSSVINREQPFQVSRVNKNVTVPPPPPVLQSPILPSNQNTKPDPIRIKDIVTAPAQIPPAPLPRRPPSSGQQQKLSVKEPVLPAVDKVNDVTKRKEEIENDIRKIDLVKSIVESTRKDLLLLEGVRGKEVKVAPPIIKNQSVVKEVVGKRGMAKISKVAPPLKRMYLRTRSTLQKLYNNNKKTRSSVVNAPSSVTGAPSIVKTVEPAPSVVKPAPPVGKTAPRITKPMSSDVKAAPSVVKPTPPITKSTPSVSKTAPPITKPTPSVGKTAPPVTKLAPSITKPLNKSKTNQRRLLKNSIKPSNKSKTAPSIPETAPPPPPPLPALVAETPNIIVTTTASSSSSVVTIAPSTVQFNVTTVTTTDKITTVQLTSSNSVVSVQTPSIDISELTDTSNSLSSLSLNDKSLDGQSVKSSPKITIKQNIILNQQIDVMDILKKGSQSPPIKLTFRRSPSKEGHGDAHFTISDSSNLILERQSDFEVGSTAVTTIITRNNEVVGPPAEESNIENNSEVAPPSPSLTTTTTPLVVSEETKKRPRKKKQSKQVTEPIQETVIPALNEPVVISTSSSNNNNNNNNLNEMAEDEETVDDPQPKPDIITTTNNDNDDEALKSVLKETQNNFAECASTVTTEISTEPCQQKDVEEIEEETICKECDKMFSSGLELLKHARSTHKFPKIKMAMSEIEKFYQMDELSKCPVCDKPLKKNFKSAFIRHLHTHANANELTHCCSVCNKKFRRLDHMREHAKRHVIEDQLKADQEAAAAAEAEAAATVATAAKEETKE